MDDSSVDLILEAAVLIDRKTNIKRKEDFIKMAGQVNDTNDDIVEDREREDRDEEKSDRGFTSSGFTSSFPSSVELPNEKHNENERKRRKMLKLSVHALRDQLKNKTRRPAVNTVLRAAFEEIQELKLIEDDQCKTLEELKQKNIILNCYLEKQLRDIKQHKRPHLPAAGQEEQDTVTPPLPGTATTNNSMVSGNVAGGVMQYANASTPPAVVSPLTTGPSLQWLSPAAGGLSFSPTLLPNMHTPSLFTQPPLPQPPQAPVLPFLSYIYPNHSPILYRPTIFIPNPSPVSPPSLIPVAAVQRVQDDCHGATAGAKSVGCCREEDKCKDVKIAKIPPLISISEINSRSNDEGVHLNEVGYRKHPASMNRESRTLPNGYHPNVVTSSPHIPLSQI